MNGWNKQMAALKLALTNLCTGGGKILRKLLISPWLTAVVFSISGLLYSENPWLRVPWIFPLFFFRCESSYSPWRSLWRHRQPLAHNSIGALVQLSFCPFLCLGSVTQCSLIWKKGNKNQKSHNDWKHAFILNRRQESNFLFQNLAKVNTVYLNRWDSKSRILRAHTS